LLDTVSVESTYLSDGRTDVTEPPRACLRASHASYGMTLSDQFSDEWLTDGSAGSCDEDIHAESSKLHDAKKTVDRPTPYLKDAAQHSRGSDGLGPTSRAPTGKKRPNAS
jgi:hypothetical protein